MIKKVSAYSIVEVVVVIVVIGLLAAVSLPGYQKSVVKSHERTGIANLLAIKAGVEFYLVNSGDPAIPDWLSLTAINNGLGLRLSDPLMTYSCSGTVGARTNVCSADHPGGWTLIFHDEHSNGLIHCESGDTCPSCPNQPGNCAG